MKPKKQRKKLNGHGLKQKTLFRFKKNKKENQEPKFEEEEKYFIIEITDNEIVIDTKC